MPLPALLLILIPFIYTPPLPLTLILPFFSYHPSTDSYQQPLIDHSLTYLRYISTYSNSQPATPNIHILLPPLTFPLTLLSHTLPHPTITLLITLLPLQQSSSTSSIQPETESYRLYQGT